MRLYHGTSEEHLDSILAKGIQPRETHGNSNWDHTVTSRPNLVYLTDTYPWYFGLQAGTGDNWPAVLEVDVQLESLVPDEDALAQALSTLPNQSTGLFELTRQVRPEMNGGLKLWSLENLGTVAHLGTIPSTTIYRYAVCRDRQFLSQVIEPTISFLNRQLCGPRYQQLLALSFGDVVEMNLVPQEFSEAFPELYPDRLLRFEDLDITVVDV